MVTEITLNYELVRGLLFLACRIQNSTVKTMVQCCLHALDVNFGSRFCTRIEWRLRCHCDQERIMERIKQASPFQI